MKKKTLLLSLLFFAGLILSACQPYTPPNPPTETPIGDSNGEVEYQFGQDATVDSVEVVLLESFPLQAQAIISGTLPDGCTELFEISVEQLEQQFFLTLTTRRLVGNVACTQALVPFEETVALDIRGLGAGTYTVIAQDHQDTCTLDMDNSAPKDEETKYSYGSSATVKSMDVNIMESFPVQVNVTLSGYLPDGCTKIYEIDAPRDGQTFTIEVVTRRPTDLACTQALVPFEEEISLDVKGLPAGDYIVQLANLSETFTLGQDNE